MWPFRSRKKQIVTTSSTSIVDRVSRLLRANVHDMLDKAEDPEKMMDQIIRDYVNNMEATQEAVQETIANLRLIETQQAKDEESLAEWQHRAQLAAARTKDLRAKGKDDEAAQAEIMAKRALDHQVAAEQRIAQRAPNIEYNNNVAEQLKSGLRSMEDRLESLRVERNDLLARYKLAKTQESFADTMNQINTNNSAGALSQLSSKVEEVEARSQAAIEVSSNSMNSQWEELENQSASIEAQNRFEALMSGESADDQKSNRQLEG